MTNRPIVATGSETTGTWSALLLGIVFVIAALFVLTDVVRATMLSAIGLGGVLLVVGASEIFQAVSAQHWRGFFLRLLIGLLYAACGVMLVLDPMGASVFLTLLFGLGLIASGVVRLFQATQYWQWSGWLLLVSGIVGIVAGLVILAKWPFSGLWAVGTLVAVDLLLHGIWWIALSFGLRQDDRAIRN